MKNTIRFILLICICFLGTSCATNLVVDSTSDIPDTNPNDGECKTANYNCTLRAAIMEANASPDVSRITFANNITLITPETLLPPLTAGNTHIDGEGSVVIDGSNVVQNNYGLMIEKSDHNIIQGLKIRNYVVGVSIQSFNPNDTAQYNTIGLMKNETNDGTQRNVIILNAHGVIIRGEGANNNRVAGNHIGIHNDGSTTKANIHSGVVIRGGAHDNLIGSLTGNSLLEGGNLISGNGQHGVYIWEGSYSNHISGNLIGTNLTGTTAVNNNFGIRIADESSGNTIGISLSGEGQGNLISGNGTGIKVENSSSTVIAGNLIGTDPTGAVSVANSNGLILDSSASSIIGTNGDGVSDELEGNLISGNDYTAIEITQGNSNNNIIAGNKIGTDITGANVLANGGSGIISEGEFTRIGTDGDGVSDELEGNLISGNDRYGIRLSSSGNRISGNIIGLDISGTGIIGNSENGIQIGPSSAHNLIGTDGNGVSDELERNIISGNGPATGNNFGIMMESVTDSTIAGNYIGPDISGTIALSNNQGGIFTSDNSDFNIFGTNGDGSADLVEGNLISGNGGYAMQILESNGNIISGNKVGTDISGTSALVNGSSLSSSGYGSIRLGGSNNLVGTNGDGSSDQLEGNLISGNLTSGIELAGENNVIAGNKIGTDITGTAALGNSGTGILLWFESSNNRIGTDGDGQSDFEEANYVGANGGHGLQIQNPDVTVAGNFIGTDSSGTIDLGNALNGIWLRNNATDIVIGGSVEKSNIIAFNGGNGINFQSNVDNKALITYNSIHSNQDLGIDLSPSGGVTINDPGDLDTGANGLMNYPVLSSASSVTGFIAITGDMVSSLPNTSYLVQFFDNENCDSPSGYGEGKTYIGSSQVWADINGNGPFSASFVANVPAGHYVTATATAYGKTSEFSACVEVTGGESTYSEENDPCDQFNPELMTLTTFNVRPETNLFYLYVKNTDPYPGSGPDEGDWKYYANLGDISAYKCSFDGPEDRVYCYFSIPENYINTVQPLKMFSNICIPPFYTNDEVSIFSQDPTGSPGSPDNPPGTKPEGCHSGLDKRNCISLGGNYIEETSTCFCPRSAD